MKGAEERSFQPKGKSWVEAERESCDYWQMRTQLEILRQYPGPMVKAALGCSLIYSHSLKLATLN